MTDDLEDSGQWRDSGETRLGEDLSKLHLERDLLQALHDTQQDHTARLTRLETGLGELRQEVREVQTGFGRVQVGVEAIRDQIRTVRRLGASGQS